MQTGSDVSDILPAVIMQLIKSNFWIQAQETAPQTVCTWEFQVKSSDFDLAKQKYQNRL